MKSTSTPTTSEFGFRLDAHSGVPVYRQLIDKVLAGVATGALRSGDQLPTVRQVAVDLAINPNTVMRAYREMEIRGIVDTQQGTGTFIAEKRQDMPQEERARQLRLMAEEFVARAASLGFTLPELVQGLERMHQDGEGRRRKS
jgi:GntR family transcriptional regulator